MPDLFDLSAWPCYEIGPRDSVFALGVVSVNYSRLEWALGGIFTNVVGLSIETAWSLLPRLGTDARIALMREALARRDWPDERKDRIHHFIDGFKVLAENRNLLMHSNLTTGVKDQIALYKPNRSGKTILVSVIPEELRQVADDMEAYFNYGMMVTNMIGLEFGNLKALTRDIPPWPEQPPAPRRLNYSSRP
jgi:hypothetical protein